MKNFFGKFAIVLGLGKSGLSAASFLAKMGAYVLGVDKKSVDIELLSRTDPLLSKNFKFHSENDKVPIEEADIVIKSPGISLQHPLVARAIKQKNIFDELDLGASFLRKKGAKLFAVTGSNGKTTTTSLITHILNHYGVKAKGGGNIGFPLTALAMETEIVNYYVVELSSFQLCTLRGKLFDAGLILNITPNHLDWHPDWEHYIRAKCSLKDRLVKNAPLFVSSALYEDPQITKFLKSYPIQILQSCFSQDLLQNLAIDAINLQGTFALCELANISYSCALKALPFFKKPPHRFEYLEKKDGVVYINDSKSTTIAATIHAVSFCRSPVVLIAGGKYKGGDFKHWIPSFKNKVKKVFAIGQAGSLIAEALGQEINVEKIEYLADAVKQARLIADPGDTILLSPGCSSLDQFDDYEQRGDLFKQIAIELYK